MPSEYMGLGTAWAYFLMLPGLPLPLPLRQLLQMPEKASLPLVSLGGAISAPALLVLIFLALTDILEA